MAAGQNHCIFTVCREKVLKSKMRKKSICESISIHDANPCIFTVDGDCGVRIFRKYAVAMIGLVALLPEGLLLHVPPFLGGPLVLARVSGESFENHRVPPGGSPARIVAYLQCTVTTSKRGKTHSPKIFLTDFTAVIIE